MKDFDPCEYHNWIDHLGRMRARHYRRVKWLNIGTVILVACLSGLFGLAMMAFISGVTL